MGRNEQPLLAEESGKSHYYLAAMVVALLSLGPPTSALERAPRSTAAMVLPNRLGDGSQAGCRATTGTIDDVETRLKVPAHAETAEVSMAVRSENGDEVTVTLGALPEVAAMYEEIRVGRKVAVHCSVPTLQFLKVRQVPIVRPAG